MHRFFYPVLARFTKVLPVKTLSLSKIISKNIFTFLFPYDSFHCMMLEHNNATV